MKLTIPSTTVKCRFLKTLPVGTIYKDPRNGHSYIIEEMNAYQRQACHFFAMANAAAIHF